MLTFANEFIHAVFCLFARLFSIISQSVLADFDAIFRIA